MRKKTKMNVTLNDVLTILQEHESFVITTHVNPDGDAIGSLLALGSFLEKMNKKVHLVIDDEITASYKFLKGLEKINKPNATLNADLLIVLDASDYDRIGNVKNITNSKILNIDHHISNANFADYLYLDCQATATGEIIYELFQLAKFLPDENIATALYTAIASDCGFFRYANTTAKVMRYGADLISYGAKPNIISEELEKRPLANIKALAKVLDTLELHYKNKVACITASMELVKNASTTEGFIDIPRTILGVDVAVMVKEVDPTTIRVSMRSKNTDVSKIAAKFSGGGHKRAAGCTINKSILEAKEAIVTAIIYEMENSK